MWHHCNSDFSAIPFVPDRLRQYVNQARGWAVITEMNIPPVAPGAWVDGQAVFPLVRI